MVSCYGDEIAALAEPQAMATIIVGCASGPYKYEAAIKESKAGSGFSLLKLFLHTLAEHAFMDLILHWFKEKGGLPPLGMHTAKFIGFQVFGGTVDCCAFSDKKKTRRHDFDLKKVPRSDKKAPPKKEGEKNLMSYINIRIRGIPYCQAKSKGNTSAALAWTKAVKEQTQALHPIAHVCLLRVTFLLPNSKFPSDLPYGPDLDNLLKRLMDALNETIFSKAQGRDSCVISLSAMKTKVASDDDAGVHLEVLPL